MGRPNFEDSVAGEEPDRLWWESLEDSKPLQQIVNEPKFPTGQTVQLCVAHQINPHEKYNRQAVMIVDGWSVCKDCADTLVVYLKGGANAGKILEDITKGDFH